MIDVVHIKHYFWHELVLSLSSHVGVNRPKYVLTSASVDRAIQWSYFDHRIPFGRPEQHKTHAVMQWRTWCTRSFDIVKVHARRVWTHLMSECEVR